MGKTAEEAEPKTGERIAKVIARAGICSRRDAEKLIADGRVALGGQKVTSPALNVPPARSPWPSFLSTFTCKALYQDWTAKSVD